MRINRYISTATGHSRRQADKLIDAGKVLVDGKATKTGQLVEDHQKVSLNGQLLRLPATFTTIMLNKPISYVVSRNGQGSRTIYDLLPSKYHDLKPIGRLDKDSSGLLLLTNNGQLAQELSHPSSIKLKIYAVKLDKELSDVHSELINSDGIKLEDGFSRFSVTKLKGNGGYQVKMSEGRNRQIRRTFAAVGYKVTGLNRTSFGDYSLNGLAVGQYLEI